MLAVSQDGAWVAVSAGASEDGRHRRVSLLSLGGGKPRDLPAEACIVFPQDVVARWSRDGKSLLVVGTGGPNYGRIDAIDVAAGTRKLLRKIPVDPVVDSWLSGFAITPDGTSFAYSTYRTVLSDLYLVEGLK